MVRGSGYQQTAARAGEALAFGEEGGVCRATAWLKAAQGLPVSKVRGSAFSQTQNHTYQSATAEYHDIKQQNITVAESSELHLLFDSHMTELRGGI